MKELTFPNNVKDFSSLNTRNETNTFQELVKDIEDLRAKKVQIQNQVKTSLLSDSSFTKERFSKLATYWSTIYDFELSFSEINDDFTNLVLNRLNTTDQRMSKINNLITRDNKFSIHKLTSIAYSNVHLLNKEFQYFLKEFEAIFIDFDKSDRGLETSKFWFGEDIYWSIRNYLNSYLIFLENFKLKQFDKCLDNLKNIKSQKNIIDITIKNQGLNI